MIEVHAVFVDVVKLALGQHFVHVHGKVRVGHLLFNGALRPSRAVRRVKKERAVLARIKRSKKRDALNVVPVEVRQENMRGDRSAVAFLNQLLAQVKEAGAAVKDVNMPSDAPLYAGGVAAVAQVL